MPLFVDIYICIRPCNTDFSRFTINYKYSLHMEKTALLRKERLNLQKAEKCPQEDYVFIGYDQQKKLPNVFSLFFCIVSRFVTNNQIGNFFLLKNIWFLNH